MKYQKREQYIRRKIEPFLHGVPIIYAIATASSLVAKKNVNSDGGGMCFDWVYEPPHCIGYDDGEIREGFTIPCGRGRKGGAPTAAIIGFFLTLFIVPVVMGISLGLIYRSVLQQEKKVERYRANTFNAGSTQHTNQSETNTGAGSSLTGRLNRLTIFRRSTQQPCLGAIQERSKSRAVMHRAFAYAVAYFLSWFFVIFRVAMSLAGYEWNIVIWYLTSITSPLQGFYNLIIFLYPKVLSAKRSKRDNLTWFQAITKALWSRGNDTSSGSRGQQSNGNNTNIQTSNIQPEPAPNQGNDDDNHDSGDASDREEEEQAKASGMEDRKLQVRRRSSELV